MKKVPFVIILLIGLLNSSCEKKSENQVFPFVGEIMRINPDCNIHEINITEGLDKIIELCGNSIGSVYIAGNLPDSLNVEGLRIEFNIGEASLDKITACTTMGPSYNWVWITDAKPK
jgi:hypothetical protein